MIWRYVIDNKLANLPEWSLLTDEQKVLTRSLRSKKGIKCEVCGNVGYYSEICPNNCYKPPEVAYETVVGLARFDDDDDDQKSEKNVSGGGDGYIFYTDRREELPQKTKIHRGNKKADLNPLKDQMRTEKIRLRGEDSQLSDYVYYRDAPEGYARDMSELNLHQALRRLMRVLEREIEMNVQSLEASVDITLFHPPAQKIGEDFYPEEIGRIKQYRDYFTQHKIKKDRLYQAYQHKGSVRSDNSLDQLFRDSKATSQVLYEPDKNAGLSMHAKIGWKDILATGDNLAIADPAMAVKVANVDKLLKRQGAWTEKQKQAFIQTNERYMHIWYIIKSEIHMEHDRERRLLTVDVSNKERTEKDIWRERIDSADRIMATIAGYGLSNGTIEADYAIFCIKKWKEELMASNLRRKKRIEAGIVDRLDVAAAAATAAATKKKRAERRKRRARGTGGKMVKSIAATRIGTAEEFGDDDDEDQEDDNEDDTSSINSASVSLNSSLDSANRIKAANLAATIKTESKGGFHGLGLLSTVGAAEVQQQEGRSSAAVTAQLLLGGPLSIFGDDLLKSEMTGGSVGSGSKTKSRVSGANGDGPDGGLSKSTLTAAAQRSMSESKSSRSKYTLKRKPFVDHRAMDNMKMKEISTIYTNVGMQRNIRTGANTDLTTLTPALIPFHDVITNIGKPEDMIQSYAGYNAVHTARMKQVNPVSGYVPKSYVPLYVRTTLFETNGTSASGDQTYTTMAKDRRYSAQLGRAMATLEATPFATKKKKNEATLEDKSIAEGSHTTATKIRIK